MKMSSSKKNRDEIVDKALQGLSVPKGMGKEAVWNRIFDRLDTQEDRKVVRMWSLASRVAAMFFGIMVLGSLIWIFILGNESVYSPYGSHVELNLPDGSVVKLNADSHIQYNKVLWSFNRKVILKGEALFKVKKGERFSVKTEDVVTEVLGTTFNIYSRNNEIRVSCLEGRVGVTDKKTKQSYTLEPNQKVLYEMNNLESPTEVNELEMAGWIEGEFYFNNQPLLKVVEELQRQYNVKVVIKSSSDRLYTGVFYSNNLHEALDLIFTPLNLKWSLQNDVVTVTKQ